MAKQTVFNPGFILDLYISLYNICVTAELDHFDVFFNVDSFKQNISMHNIESALCQ